METMPLTAKEALDLWDSGEPVPAFQVEAAPERQPLVYGAAFELLRTGEIYDLPNHPGGLSEREQDVARSIAEVAKTQGWAKMVSLHTHQHSPAITIKKS